ncbi:MAG: hypothetical protein K2X87_21260 [Gemmataceae bacterium]|nr:hypothetical protein [Gemmataceae bacterium]
MTDTAIPAPTPYELEAELRALAGRWLMVRAGDGTVLLAASAGGGLTTFRTPGSPADPATVATLRRVALALAVDRG